MLILNAAVFALPYSSTEDNFETTFQVCHLSHFYMVTSLENLLDHTSRVVVVSSESHRLVQTNKIFSFIRKWCRDSDIFRFSNLPTTQLSEQLLMPSKQKYWSMTAYNNAKLCNVLFARELGRVSSRLNILSQCLDCEICLLAMSNSVGKTKQFVCTRCIPVIWSRHHYHGIGGFIDLSLLLYGHSPSHWWVEYTVTSLLTIGGRTKKT